MNIVTIHTAPRKPLTFADIKPGEFLCPHAGHRYVKLPSLVVRDNEYCNAITMHGQFIRVESCRIVTLPDAPPPQDDTVEYGDLADGEMFAWDGEVWQLSDGFVRDTGYRRMQRLRDGETMSLMPSTRVRRVDSVTITRDQGSETK